MEHPASVAQYVAMVAAYVTYTYTLTILLTWLVSYLATAGTSPPTEARSLSSWPLLGIVIGNVSGASQRTGCSTRLGSTRFARRSVAIVGLLACALFVVLAALVEDGYTAVYCLTGAGFFLECTIGASWSVPMDTAGKYSGTASAMMNMAGQLCGATTSPVVFGLFAQYGNWQGPWIVAAILLVLGAGNWGCCSIPSAPWWRRKRGCAWRLRPLPLDGQRRVARRVGNAPTRRNRQAQRASARLPTGSGVAASSDRVGKIARGLA